MKIRLLIKNDLKDGCDGCVYDIEGKPCQFPARQGRPECYSILGNGSGLYVEVQDDE